MKEFDCVRTGWRFSWKAAYAITLENNSQLQ